MSDSINMPVGWFPALAGSLEQALRQGSVRRVRSIRPHEVLIEVRAGRELRKLLLSIHPRFPRAHLVESPGTPPEHISQFAAVLRKHVEGSRVESVRAVPGDRALEFDLQGRESKYRLVVECIPGKPLMALADPAGNVIGLLTSPGARGRGLAPGEPYVRPRPPENEEGPAPPPAPGFFESMEREYGAREDAFELQRLASALDHGLARMIRKDEKRIENLSRDLAGAGDPEEWRLRGELLKIHSGLVGKGMREVEVPNLFAADAALLKIQLDPRLDLKGNMEDFFKRYRKARNGRRKVEALLAEARSRVAGCLGAAARLKQAVEAGDPDAVRSIAEEAGVPLERSAKPGPARARGEPVESLPYRRFVSAEGIEIWVGRDAAENDRLTRSDARGEDLWMHVAGFGGSHVVVKAPRDREPSRETLLDAAALAAFFSQGRGKQVEVSYTHAKHVRKPKGARPGLVMMAKRQTVRVAWDEQRLMRLLGKKPTMR